MTTDSLGSTGPVGESPPRHWTSGCFRYVLYLVSWIVLYMGTLSLLATIVTNRLLGRESSEGYGAYVSLFGFLVVMPIGLLVSCAVVAVWKRGWLFLLLAVIIAAATAVAPVVVDSLRSHERPISDGGLSGTYLTSRLARGRPTTAGHRNYINDLASS